MPAFQVESQLMRADLHRRHRGRFVIGPLSDPEVLIRCRDLLGLCSGTGVNRKNQYSRFQSKLFIPASQWLSYCSDKAVPHCCTTLILSPSLVGRKVSTDGFSRGYSPNWQPVGGIPANYSCFSASTTFPFRINRCATLFPSVSDHI